MGSTAEFRRLFVQRLNQACDLSKLVPEPHHGRQTYIADKLDVTKESVSKWFKGVSVPKHGLMSKLADLLECDQTWLAFGIQAEISRSERRIHANRADGAVQLVWGLITLEGGHCGAPSKNDSRREYVDFYCTLRGAIYPIYVSLAREVSKHRYEAILPKEYEEVRTIAVVPAGVGRYHFLDMQLSKIQEHKARKGGSVVVGFNRAESEKYTTGSDTWPRIRSFIDLTWQ
jgi:transcriptional regulator with XRE-family HTH domain